MDEHHRDVNRGSTARATVFGVNDGLLTNVSLILGVVGANPPSGVVRLAGIAGLLAGAFSMAAGEYISMTAQAELFERELELERKELAKHPESERRELAALYVSRGVEKEVADKAATSIMRDPETALEVHAREELGMSPSQGVGSPIAAGAASFFSFALGALVPLLPWFFIQGQGATIASIGLGAAAALSIGFALGAFTGRTKWLSSLRQLGIVAVAAAVTYAVGSLVGVHTT